MAGEVQVNLEHSPTVFQTRKGAVNGEGSYMQGTVGTLLIMQKVSEWQLIT